MKSRRCERRQDSKYAPDGGTMCGRNDAHPGPAGRRQAFFSFSMNAFLNFCTFGSTTNMQ